MIYTTTPKISNREEEILALIADEQNSKQISKELFISVNTVKTHRKSLLLKLNVRNSAGLVRKAYELGFLNI